MPQPTELLEEANFTQLPMFQLLSDTNHFQVVNSIRLGYLQWIVLSTG